jgi:hypothetical protein
MQRTIVYVIPDILSMTSPSFNPSFSPSVSPTLIHHASPAEHPPPSPPRLQTRAPADRLLPCANRARIPDMCPEFSIYTSYGHSELLANSCPNLVPSSSSPITDPAESWNSVFSEAVQRLQTCEWNYHHHLNRDGNNSWCCIHSFHDDFTTSHGRETSNIIIAPIIKR